MALVTDILAFLHTRTLVFACWLWYALHVDCTSSGFPWFLSKTATPLPPPPPPSTTTTTTTTTTRLSEIPMRVCHNLAFYKFETPLKLTPFVDRGHLTCICIYIYIYIYINSRFIQPPKVCSAYFIGGRGHTFLKTLCHRYSYTTCLASRRRHPTHGHSSDGMHVTVAFTGEYCSLCPYRA